MKLMLSEKSSLVLLSLEDRGPSLDLNQNTFWSPDLKLSVFKTVSDSTAYNIKFL